MDALSQSIIFAYNILVVFNTSKTANGSLVIEVSIKLCKYMLKSIFYAATVTVNICWTRVCIQSNCHKSNGLMSLLLLALPIECERRIRSNPQESQKVCFIAVIWLCNLVRVCVEVKYLRQTRIVCSRDILVFFSCLFPKANQIILSI